MSQCKSIDILTTTNLISTTPVFNLLNCVQAGNNFYQRIDNKVKFDNLELSGFISASGLGTKVPEYLRINIIYDTQANAALPNIGDVILSTTQTGATSSSVLDNLNPNNRWRFQVLTDTRISIPDQVTGTGVSANAVYDYTKNEVNIRRFVTLDLPTVYNTAGTGTIADINKGALYLLVYGSQPAATAGYQLSWSCRLNYHE